MDDSVEGLNSDVLDQLVDVVGGRSAGPMMLLTAPRAGYGKTHLLGRVAIAAADQAMIVPVAFRSGDPLTLATLSRRGIESLAENSVAGDPFGWSRLREASAQVMSLLLRRMIEEGLLPCANADQAVETLSKSGQEVFETSGRASRIGAWIAQNRESLRGPLAMLAAREVPLRAEALDSWVAALLDQSIQGGLAGVAEMEELTASDNETGVPAWLRLLALWKPVILLVDHLDGLYRNPEAGVKIASMLMELVESHRLNVLLSLNQDVWQATFGHHLPSALEDRLTACQVLLRGLTEADALELLNLRLAQTDFTAEQRDEFVRFISINRHFLGRPIGSVSARAFLRHCARQWEIFHSAPSVSPESSASPPAVPEFPDNVEVDVLPALEKEPGGDIPLLTETLRLPAEAPAPALPVLFDDQTASEVQTMAESLTEPLAALPQDEKPARFIDPAPPEILEEPVAPASHNGQHPKIHVEDTGSLEDWTGKAGTNGSDLGAATTTDAFVKLREMLARLRQPGKAASALAAEGQNLSSPAPAAEGPAADPSESPFRLETGGQPPPSQPSAPSSSPFQIASGNVATAEKVTAPVSSTDLLQGRFQALRLQLQPEAMTQPLDYSRLADLIRLAGRRFPLVRFSEHELPGLNGRFAFYWSLQGLEILFGLAPFNDVAYWRTLSSFAAGRVTDLAAQAEQEGGAASKLKLVGFKSEREQFSWQSLQNSQVLPEPIRLITDIVHLDTDGLSCLYAMQRIIKESESGVLQAEPARVIGVLARELDFFWKRITRLI